MNAQSAISTNRRSALAGLAAGSLALASFHGPDHANAQDATSTPLAGHPLVGTWVILPREDATPSVAVFTADGAFIDANAGFSGSWNPTGEYTADHTFVGIITTPDFNGYVVVRGQIEVDPSGETWSQSYNAMTVAADGTVTDVSPGAVAQASRLQIVTADDPMGEALPEIPTWSPVAATPTA